MILQKTTRITVSSPREAIRVTFPDGLVLEGPVGTTVEHFLQAAQEYDSLRHDSPIMGAIVDGRLRELSYLINRDSDLEPVLLSTSDGGRIYRRSLVFLLATAIDELWPGCRVNVSHAVPDGGFYCILINHEPFTTKDLECLDARMRQIVTENCPISKRVAPLDEAVALFAARDDDDKVFLLEQRTRNELTLYTLRNRVDYYYGYMLPSTGYLKHFRLIKADGGGGFILQYPRKENPNQLREINPSAKLNAVFLQADQWLQRIGIPDMGRLNRAVRENRINEIILVAEALHEQHIANIARDISEQHHTQSVRIVLIAGPSSSGKTTFSKRLAIQLMAHGLRPFTLEMDNYFVNRELTPKDERGEYDFEALGALNLKLFNDHLLRLIEQREVQLPRFDFLLGKSMKGMVARLDKDHIIVIEGIHGLNPALVPDIPKELIYRVYVSALTQLNLDSHNRVPTTDVRLLRRIVRDAYHRGNDATSTLKRWPSVRRGEKLNIFSYQENADVMFNSALVYELAALRPLAEPLLLQVVPATPPHIEANRLLSFLRWVEPLTLNQQTMIPDTSLLREFTGGLILQDYRPGLSSKAQRYHSEDL